jgi:asparagine synthase (glutamine-hydrolysing)
MEISINNKYGWELYENNEIQLWFCGYLYEGFSAKSILFELEELHQNSKLNIDTLSNLVLKMSGHFALIAKFSNNSCFLGVDKICSIPIYDILKDDRYAVSDHAPQLKKLFNLSDADVNLNSLLEVSMSGFALGDNTIYSDIKSLTAGECVFWEHGRRQNNYYYTYSPYQESLKDYEKLKNEFKQICLESTKKLIDSVNKKQIIVSLSAGYDSRLIVSCLRELSYENVVCFTYGRSGNFEVNTSKMVADSLGYKWIYVKDTIREKRAFYKSSTYNNYINLFESYASVPSTQDIYEIYTLKKRGIINIDAVFVNGNAGDFISGGHIPGNLSLKKDLISYNEIDWNLFLDKHYSIWKKLRNSLNDKIITSNLSQLVLERLKFEKHDKVYMYSLMETMEYMGRQSRIVIGQQRSYEFIGHEWRLPFWSEDFLNFWEKVPLEYKVDQLLYKDSITEDNWGGVWKGIEVNKKIIKPNILRFTRLIVKLIMVPFGRKKWHRVERNIFVYWMHPSYSRTVTSYLNMLFDLRGEKNTTSWTADQFIKRNGFNDVLSVSRKIRSLYK